MAYQIFIRRSAEKEIADLPAKIQSRIATEIRALADQPHPSVCKELSGEDHAWRIRVVAHRKDVYR